MVAGAGVETLFQDAQAATVTENGKKHSDKQVVIFECFAVFVCVAGIDVALENTVHDRLDKGVDAGYCVHGLQLLFFELFTGFYPGEQESATLYLWVGIFFRTVVFLHWERGLGAGTARISEKGLNKPQSDEIPCFSRFGENPATTPLDEPSIYAAWRLRQKKSCRSKAAVVTL